MRYFGMSVWKQKKVGIVYTNNGLSQATINTTKTATDGAEIA